MSLPTEKEVKALDKSTKSINGLIKYLFLIFLSGLPTWVGFSNSKKLDSLIQIQQSQSQKQSQATYIASGVPTKDPKGNDPQTLGSNTDFNINDWYYDGFYNENEYLCSKVKNNKYWSIWTKEQIILADNTVTARIVLKNETKNNQTVTISLGNYKPLFAPKQIMQLNILNNNQ